jgi:myo-inositol-1(or 4)-monophosphatase
MEFREVAVRAAKEAGKITVDHFYRKHTVKTKTPRDLVTEVDIASEKRILDLIKKNFPDHSILSEESGKDQEASEYLWVVDPLDGTTNYSIKNPFYNVSIALTKNNKVILAVVYAPMTNEMFVAEKGKGAFLNGKRIHVSPERDFSKLLFAYCHGSTFDEIERITKIFAKLKPAVRDFSRMRAGALELAFVACGRLGAYISSGSNPWDVAAGALLVREAGGRVTDFVGNEWNIERNDILATNKAVHERLVEILQNE